MNEHLQQQQAEVFDRIAPGWYGFRHRSIFGPELAELARSWQGGRLLNIGCAHGQDFLPFRQGFELHGIDISAEMLKLAVKYARKFDFNVNLAQADARSLPYAGGSFDWAVAAATFHHLRGRAETLKAIKELLRVLKPGGEAFITVWNRWQPSFWSSGKEVAVPWRMRGETVYRYYYLFSRRELEGLAGQAGFVLLRSFAESRYRLPVKLFSRNICLLLKKPVR